MKLPVTNIELSHVPDGRQCFRVDCDGRTVMFYGQAYIEPVGENHTVGWKLTFEPRMAAVPEGLGGLIQQ